MQTFKRAILNDSTSSEVFNLLQSDLATLIDLSLVLKQAHWNVVGPNFRSVHLQLDEIIVTVRIATDDIAERIVTIGMAPDGRASTVAANSKLESFPEGFHQVSATIEKIGDCLMKSVEQLRSSIDKLAETDPVSQDLLISISSQLEKHLWMIQAQEVH